MLLLWRDVSNAVVYTRATFVYLHGGGRQQARARRVCGVWWHQFRSLLGVPVFSFDQLFTSYPHARFM